jgi:hypothetical protein
MFRRGLGGLESGMWMDHGPDKPLRVSPLLALEWRQPIVLAFALTLRPSGSPSAVSVSLITTGLHGTSHGGSITACCGMMWSNGRSRHDPPQVDISCVGLRLVEIHTAHKSLTMVAALRCLSVTLGESVSEVGFFSCEWSTTRDGVHHAASFPATGGRGAH